MSVDPKKAVLVTLALALVGAVVGGVLGAALLVGWGVALDGWPLPGALGRVAFLGGGFGALFGLVLGPAAAWLLMRSVPLGKAIGGTALGTAAGAVAGMALGGEPLIPLALAGFAVSAIYLRVRSASARKALGSGG